MLSLLSTSSRVEVPFIIVKIGDYSFGAYNNSKKDTTRGVSGVATKLYYPNYMKHLTVTKVNGVVNNYTIQMQYAIRAGDDPNFFEKVFSSVAKTRKITISYGDYSTPSFIYKEDVAMINKVTSNFNLNSSSITYTINCVSSSRNLSAGVFDFPKRYARPSAVLEEHLYDPSYGLLEVFYGMRNKSLVKTKGLLSIDDKEVQLEAKPNTSILDYVEYLVSCMTSVSDSNENSLIKNSKYVITAYDDINTELNGPYFKLSKISSDIQSKNSIDMYEIDIGYPNENIVTSFNIDDNETYSLLYDYSKKIEQRDYVYRVDDNGSVISQYSPSIATSKTLFKTTEAERSWWTNVTKFPITATLTIRGLLRPTILTSYVKINTLFYGRKHISSGIYMVTKQVDDISESGFTTTLSLTRISSDNSEQVNDN